MRHSRSDAVNRFKRIHFQGPFLRKGTVGRNPLGSCLQLSFKSPLGSEFEAILRFMQNCCFSQSGGHIFPCDLSGTQVYWRYSRGVEMQCWNKMNSKVRKHTQVLARTYVKANGLSIKHLQEESRYPTVAALGFLWPDLLFAAVIVTKKLPSWLWLAVDIAVGAWLL